MGTRSLFTFSDAEQAFNVYVHWDGYPTEAAKKLTATLPLAWTLPRFEPDEFAAAFVAANKSQPGNVRLYPTGAWVDHVRQSDIEWHYAVSQTPEGKLAIECSALRCFDDNPICKTWKFKSLEAFVKWASSKRNPENADR